MRVRDIMTEKPITAHPQDSVAHALELMLSGGFHHLPILSKSRHLVGIVTQRDCRIALHVPEITSDLPLKERGDHIQLKSIMSKAPIVTAPDADVFEAALLMYENQINSLPVMLDETLVGIMTASDLLVACIHLTRSQRKTPSHFS